MILIEERLLCQGKRVKLFQKVYRYGDDLVVRDVVKFGQSVAVVPLKNRNKVIMVKQFRVPVGSWVIEIPAGRVEPEETPEEAAIRELREEIGYIPKYLQKVVSLYISPGYSDEILHIYLAKDLEYVGSAPEKGEFIEVLEMDLDSALRAVLKNGIADAKTFTALLMAKYLIEQKMI